MESSQELASEREPLSEGGWLICKRIISHPSDNSLVNDLELIILYFGSVKI